MKLQFSLATLLVCVTVLAVVCAFAIRRPVIDLRTNNYDKPFLGDPLGDPLGYPLPADAKIISISKSHFTFERPPNVSEIALRFVTWGIPAIAATLGVLWIVRRLKSRRHTDPPADKTTVPATNS